MQLANFLIFVVFTFGSATDLATYTYTFTQVYKIPTQRQGIKDPAYMVFMRRGIEITSMEIPESRLELLLKKFGAKQASTLVGKSFKTEHKSATRALERLILDLLHGGTYMPPSAKELIRHAAEALAKFENPDFSRVDTDTIFQVFIREYKEGTLIPKLTNLVHEISGGEITLLPAKELPFGDKSQGIYLELTSSSNRIVVLVGPYPNPIQIRFRFRE